MKTNVKRILTQTAEHCNECGTCMEHCDHLKIREDAYPGRIATAALNQNRVDEIKDLILKCSLCGLCRETCPEGVDFPRMVQEIRSDFIDTGVIDPEEYRFLWVDHDWHVYSLYRQAYKLDDAYNNLLKKTGDILFFPGCILANESPELVQAAAGWLGRDGENVAASLHCCGIPLAHIGLEERASAYSERLWNHIKATGASRVVTACPTCHRRLAQTNQSDIEIVSIFKLMADAGMRVPVTESHKITVHDSCSDRHGEMGHDVRKLLGNYDLREMKHSGDNTICCGAGGIVSVIDPDVCIERAETRLKEAQETEADMCVTYCMSCAYQLGVHSQQHPIRYILELVFNQPVDHARFDEQAYGMWQEETGEERYERLQNSKIATF